MEPLLDILVMTGKIGIFLVWIRSEIGESSFSVSEQ